MGSRSRTCGLNDTEHRTCGINGDGKLYVVGLHNDEMDQATL